MVLLDGQLIGIIFFKNYPPEVKLFWNISISGWVFDVFDATNQFYNYFLVKKVYLPFKID